MQASENGGGGVDLVVWGGRERLLPSQMYCRSLLKRCALHEEVVIHRLFVINLLPPFAGIVYRARDREKERETGLSCETYR